MSRIVRLRGALLWGVLLVLLSIRPHLAEAVTVHWTLSGVTFGDGASASGSFNYDAGIQAVSGFDVTTTATPTSCGPGCIIITPNMLPGNHYVDLNGDQPPYPSSGFGILIIQNPLDFTNAPFIALGFSTPLSDAGGIVPLAASSGEGFCVTSDCGSGNYYRHVSAGVVSGAAVPEPSTIVPLLIAAVAVCALGRRSAGRIGGNAAACRGA